MLYVLDEPSIGLHQRDNAKLLESLKGLRDIGNTVLVVEHDEDAIRSADHLIDMGPGAGIHGGHIIAEGTPDDIMREPEEPDRAISHRHRADPGAREAAQGGARPLAEGRSARRGNNLKNVTAKIPLGTFTCVTGVSGGGKSTLIDRDALQGRGAQAEQRARASGAA